VEGLAPSAIPGDGYQAPCTVIFTWLWIATGQRLFVVVVAHASVNTPLFFWGMLVPADGRALQAWYFQEAVYAIAAMLIVLIGWRRWTTKEYVILTSCRF
jgi:hypothetical protein